MTQEPWCFSLDQISRMTFYQIARYHRAAERREKALKGGETGSAPSNLDVLSAGVPPLEEFVAAMRLEFPTEDPDRWPRVWEDAKRIEGEKARAAADRNAPRHG